MEDGRSRPRGRTKNPMDQQEGYRVLGILKKLQNRLLENTHSGNLILNRALLTAKHISKPIVLPRDVCMFVFLVNGYPLGCVQDGLFAMHVI
jgi:hypothetical protein